MKTQTLLLLAVVALAGCAAQVKPMQTPSGKQGFLVSCDGSADNWTTCYTAAAQACKGKYNVVDRNESATPTMYGPMIRRNMVAECP